MSEDTCPNCGAELADVGDGSCLCVMDGPKRPKKPQTGFAGSMRQMVARKLGKIPRTDGK